MDFKKLLSVPGIKASKPDYSSAGYNDILIECYNYRGMLFVPPGMIIDLMNKILPEHYSGLKQVVYEPQLYNPFPKNSKEYKIGGKFFRADKSINIGMVINENELKSTFYHEMGHLIHVTGNSGIKLSEWLAISGSSQGYVSEYAKSSAFEDFAESYSTYLIAPDKLRTVSEKKYQFIHALFRGYHEDTNTIIHKGWIG